MALIPERVSMKDAFGGEVPFTTFIANNQDAQAALMAALDRDSSEYSIQTVKEVQTRDGKRADLVVYNEDGEVELVIESQDSSGWLDSIHASKIFFYMFEKGCSEGVLLTEDTSELVRDFIKYKNENSPENVWIVTVSFFKINGEIIVDFKAILRPYEGKKKIRSTSEKSERTYGNMDFYKDLREKRSDIFNHNGADFVQDKNVNNTRLNVFLRKRKKGYSVGVWIDQPGTTKSNAFTDYFDEKAIEHNISDRSRNKTKVSNLGYITDLDKAIALHQEIVADIKSGKLAI